MRTRDLARFILALFAGLCLPSRGADNRPSVLFYGYAPHADYVAKPLQAMGVEVGTCAKGKLAQAIANDNYHVLVVATMNDADRQAVDSFLARGGGVLVCNPNWYSVEGDFEKTCQWLATKGARPRWEMLKDSSPSNIVQVTFGALSWSDDVRAPVQDGVRGVLTVLFSSASGGEPPMPYDFSSDWTICVRGAASMSSASAKRNDPTLQIWQPKEPISARPPLMGVRQVGPGRLAVIGLRTEWVFAPPDNCPPVEAMLKYDRGNKPSDWLRVIANAFHWLAEPSLQAGWRGTNTPTELLNPPVQAWEIPPIIDWNKSDELKDARETPGMPS